MPVFNINEHYQGYEIGITQLNAEDVPWDNPVAPIPLYAHFVANPEAFHLSLIHICFLLYTEAEAA